MPRKWRFRLRDILNAIGQLEHHTRGLDRRSFKRDNKTVHAVLYNLYVIGEAASHLPKTVREKHPGVDWNRIRGLRNVIAHEYFAVHLDIVWQAATEDAPALTGSLRKILDEEPDDETRSGTPGGTTL